MSKQDSIRQAINETIIRHLESGQLPPWNRGWRKNGITGHHCNIVSKKNYRGINPWMCEIASMEHGFSSKFWGTFHQWKKLGGSVRKRPANVKPGQWGTKIVFWSPVTKAKKDKQGNELEDKTFFILKNFTIFNLDQVDGDNLDHLRAETSSEYVADDFATYEQAENLITATKADIRYSGDKAFYNSKDDLIQLPPKEVFDSSERFYETAFHELSHWTEHESRLNWDRSKPENDYATGELIAEISANYLASEMGLKSTSDISNSSAYLKHWLASMKNDVSFIFKASSQANKATDFLLSFVQQTADELAVA